MRRSTLPAWNWIILLLAFGLLPQLCALTPEEAASHVGEDATVEGLVVQVAASKVVGIHLNFGGKFPNEVFSAYVSPGDFDAVGTDFLKSLKGMTVALTGKIVSFKNKPQIVINTRDQIKVTAAPPP